MLNKKKMTNKQIANSFEIYWFSVEKKKIQVFQLRLTKS
jgi:hypothetical protein